MNVSDLQKFFNQQYSNFFEKIKEISKTYNSSIPFVDSDYEMYNFDKISEKLYDSNPEYKPTSADGMFFYRNKIYLVEFKTGFYQKVRKDNYDPVKGDCKYLGGKCKNYWDIFYDNQKRKIDELINSIKMKAIESYFLLEKRLDFNQNTYRQSKVELIVVIDTNGIDGLEDVMSSVANSNTDNKTQDVRNSLFRFINQKDIHGHPYLYNQVNVKNVTEFQSFLKNIS